MKTVKCISVGIVVLFALSLIGIGSADAWWWVHRAKNRPAAAAAAKAHVISSQKAKVAAHKVQKQYAYVQTHDYNGDGVVDMKDRVIWVNMNKSTASTVLISSENADILEIIDTNGDGSVTREEIVAFYRTYDSDGNGKLDSAEINAAVE